ncbi:SRPBCC family protein [Puia sp. P3]|uniref:SRPBCC family protein n=1 Tax=Puia sp. P3 TaxID=3423952 RepID=UPI003D67F613
MVFAAGGVIHEFIPERKIIRTFEMANAPAGVQLEVYQFEGLTDDRSKLTMHVIYESVAQRDQVMGWGFAPGINMAHDRIEKVMSTVK